MTDLITIPAVPIARVGDWPAASGSGLLEPEDLQSMVDASQDPEIQAAGPVRGWLGHNGAFDDWGDPIPRDPYDTSEPAIGTVQNLALTDDGQTLVADLVDVPEIVAVLYPQRSIETVGGVVTKTGRGYRTVLTGMAYLGRSDPAINGMPDLLDAVRASTSSALASGGVRFTGEPALMSALPAETRAPADDRTVARVTRRALAQAALADLAPDGADTTAAAAAPTTEQPMPQNTTPPADTTPPENQETPETPAGAEEETETEESEEEVVVAETVTVDAATFAAMQAQIADLAQERQTRLAAEHAEGRTRLLAQAVETGRFPEGRRDHYAALYDADPEGTTQLVESLEPGLVPTSGRRLSTGAAAPAAGDLVIKAGEPLPAGLSLLTTAERQRHNGAR